MRYILAIILILACGIANADEIQVPFSCYPKHVQQSFKKHNLKLDLSANERTPGSWGFIESKGSRYNLYSYDVLTEEELSLITRIVMENINDKNFSK